MDLVKHEIRRATRKLFGKQLPIEFYRGRYKVYDDGNEEEPDADDFAYVLEKSLQVDMGGLPFVVAVSWATAPKVIQKGDDYVLMGEVEVVISVEVPTRSQIERTVKQALK